MATFAKRVQPVLHPEEFRGVENPRAEKVKRMQALHTGYVATKIKRSQPGNTNFFRRLLKNFSSSDRIDG